MIFVPCIEFNKEIYKIFQLFFGRDGSIYLHLPYYAHNEGIVGIGVIPAGTRQLENLNFAETGKTTRNLVKLSYHLSGEVLVSKTKKVDEAKTIRKNSINLLDANGHIFTVKFQGLNDFTVLGKRKKNRQNIIFPFRKIDSDAFKIIGRWYSNNEFKKRFKPSSKKVQKGPVINCFEYETGKLYPGILISPPRKSFLRDHILLLTCLNIDKFDEENDSTLTLIGGLDHPDIAKNTLINTSFIFIVYPYKTTKELKKGLESIDILDEE